MQSTGQASTQAVSFTPMQGSAMTYAMIPVPFIVVIAMMFVPTAMQSTVVVTITILISIAVAVPIPITVALAIPLPVAAVAWAASPGSGTPCSATAGRYVAVLSIRWNA